MGQEYSSGLAGWSGSGTFLRFQMSSSAAVIFTFHWAAAAASKGPRTLTDTDGKLVLAIGGRLQFFTKWISK